jgi:hypothetical protein
MDAYVPHPPIDHAVFILYAFTRIFFTSSQPIDFAYGIKPEHLNQRAQFLSLKARRALYSLYQYFVQTVVVHPYHRNLLDSAYMHALSVIHIKFQTGQTNSPFDIPTW